MSGALRAAWWPAAAAVTRLAGDLSLAEDCAQEACAAAVEQWPRDGLPGESRAAGSSRSRGAARLDHLRRESARAGKERDAVQDWAACPDGGTVAGDDQLALLFACRHPALDPASRVTLTLRIVCGLPAASIARLLLLPEPAVAQRIVRAKRKIRDAGIRLRVPDPGERLARLASVLRAIYLTFTEGHAPHGTGAVVRDDLCEEALRLAARLHRLLPDEPEVTGLLALILLTSARAAARSDEDGALVLLADQDRSRWGPGPPGRGTVSGRSGAGPAPSRPVTSCRPPSPPATPTRRHPPTLTGGDRRAVRRAAPVRPVPGHRGQPRRRRRVRRRPGRRTGNPRHARRQLRARPMAAAAHRSRCAACRVRPP